VAKRKKAQAGIVPSMKIKLLYVETSKDAWIKSFEEDYKKKISRFVKLELLPIKSSKHSRDQAQQKIKDEEQKILKAIKDNEFVILCDERGKSFSSEDFAKKLKSLEDTANKDITLVIGGAFGIGAEVKNRANLTLKLSEFVLSHQIALTVVMEQLYRAQTIVHGKKYHNS
jgi:23S rRNA (pseudouridine1915-N3)-methyltransferase